MKKSPYKDFSNFTSKEWTGDGFSPDEGIQDQEDASKYGKNKEFEYSRKHIFPGFVTVLDIFKSSKEESLSILQKLSDNKWIDSKTVSILCDFVLYNPYIETFAYVQVLFLFSKTGSISPKLQIFNIDLNYYGNSGLFIFRAALEGIFIILLSLYIIQQPFSIYTTYAKVYDEFQEDEYAKSKLQENNEKEEKSTVGKIFLCISNFLCNNLKLAFTVIYVHLTSLWNLLDMLNIILALVNLIYWIKFIVTYAQVNISPRMFLHTETSDEFYTYTQLLYTNKSLCSYSLIITFIRVLKYLNAIFERVSVLFGTLARAGPEVCYFIILLIFMMTPFVLYVYIFFGSQSKAYSSLTLVFSKLFFFMNWWYISFDSLLKYDLIAGLFIFTIFMICIVFILMNIFVGILLMAFRAENKLFKYKHNGRDSDGSKISYGIEEHWILSVYKWILAIMGRLYGRYEKMKNELEAKDKRFEYKLRKLKDESEEFNTEYNPLKSFSSEKNRIPLTSLFIEEKANIERDRRCGMIFYKGLTHVAFMSILIIILTLQLKIGLGAAIVRQAKEKLLFDVKFKVEGGTGSEPTFIKIVDFEYYAYWIEYAFPSFLEDSYNNKTLFKNLIGNEFRITFRQGKLLDGKTNLDMMSERIMQDSDLSNAHLSGERTESIVGNDSGVVYNYSSSGGYNNKGGYTEYWNASYSSLVNETFEFIHDGVIGPDTWLFAIEFIEYDLSSNMYLYNTIVMKSFATGKIIQQLRFNPLPTGIYSSPTDFVRLILEVIFLILLGYFILRYFIEFQEKWRDYDAWLEKEYMHFTPLQIYQRNQKCPEFLRKLKYVFSIFRVIDLLSYSFALTAIVYWIIFVSNSVKINRAMPYNHNDYDFLTDIPKNIQIFSNYINFSSLTLVFLAFRLLENLQFAGNMRTLTSTIFNAQEDLFYFIIIFASLLIGFAGMVNIAFGEIDANFSSVGQALQSCYIMLIRQFEISGILDDNLISASIFVFSFMILFSYVLLNVFFAILKNAFSQAKEDFTKIEEGVRKKNVILCCFLPNHEEKNDEQNNLKQISLRDLLRELNGLNFIVTNVHSSLRWWADNQAEFIKREIEGRAASKRDLKRRIMIVHENCIQTNPKALDAAGERKKFMQYLRISNQYMKYQVDAIEKEMENLEKDIQFKTKEYFQEKENAYQAENIVEEVDRALCTNFKFLEELEKKNRREKYSFIEEKNKVLEPKQKKDKKKTMKIFSERVCTKGDDKENINTELMWTEEKK